MLSGVPAEHAHVVGIDAPHRRCDRPTTHPVHIVETARLERFGFGPVGLSHVNGVGSPIWNLARRIPIGPHIEHSRAARQFLDSLTAMERSFAEQMRLEEEANAEAGPEKLAMIEKMKAKYTYEYKVYESLRSSLAKIGLEKTYIKNKVEVFHLYKGKLLLKSNCFLG